MYLAPRFHLPSEGADLHQAGHCGGRFDSCTAVFLRHHALRAVDELDTGHSPLSYTQIAGHRAGRCPEYLPPGSMKGFFFKIILPFAKIYLGYLCVIYLAGQLWVLQETTAVGLGKLLHSESSTTSSSPSVSPAQYSTLLATPPPHVTLQTPCLERHLVVMKNIIFSFVTHLPLNT